jgi:protein SCO1/2
VEFAPRDLRLALVEASAGRLGSAVDRLMLFCFMYDPSTGRYSRLALSAVRAGAVATVLLLVVGVAVLLRREAGRRRARVV